MQSLTYSADTKEKTKAVHDELIAAYGTEAVIIALIENMDATSSTDFWNRRTSTTDTSSDMQTELSNLKAKYNL